MTSEKNLELLEMMLESEMEAASEYGKWVQKIKDRLVIERLSNIMNEEMEHVKLVNDAIKRAGMRAGKE